MFFFYFLRSWPSGVCVYQCSGWPGMGWDCFICSIPSPISEITYTYTSANETRDGHYGLKPVFYDHVSILVYIPL